MSTGVHLLIEIPHGRADASRFVSVQYRFPASRAELAVHVGDGGGLALTGVRHVARVAHQFGGAADGALHGGTSLRRWVRASLNAAAPV